MTTKKADTATNTPPRPRRAVSAEIQAMGRIDQILCELPPAEALRVVQWLGGKFLSPATYAGPDAAEDAR